MADGSFQGIPTADQPGHEQVTDPMSLLLRMVPDYEKIEGWLKLDTAELLFAAAASIKSGCIVEIGSYRGRSTVALCAGSNAGAKIPVYAIEPHEHFVGAKGGVFGPADRKAFFRTMLTTKLCNIVRLINATSAVVGAGWDKAVSLLFIDGDHRYEAVLFDFTVWRQHLIDGAIVIFHDAGGTGTDLLIKDLVKGRTLTHIQTIGRLAMFQFEAPEDRADPEDITYPGKLRAAASPLSHLPRDRGPQIDDSLYGSETRKYLYQAIPNCAVAPVKTALMDLQSLSAEAAQHQDGKPHRSADTSLILSDRQAEVLAGQADIFKFVFVRDPYSRLARAYTRKLAPVHGEQNNIWVERLRHAAAEQGRELSEKITFEDFVRTVSAQPQAAMDIQWRPQYHCGRFDEIKFDFIGRAELISSDFAYVLERIGAPIDFAHRAIQPHNVSASNLAIWSSVSGDVRKSFLTAFAIDFEMLRYPMRRAGIVMGLPNFERPIVTPFALPDTQQSNPQKHKRRKSMSQATSQEEYAPGHREPSHDGRDEGAPS